MSIRTTAAEVKEIMENCTTSDAIVGSLIIAASAVVDQVYSTDTEIGSTLLAEIERWLTAHMLASSLNRTGSNEKVGDASITYTGKWGLGLDSTPYGQMVKQLDTTGKIAKMGKAAASMYAVKNFD